MAEIKITFTGGGDLGKDLTLALGEPILVGRSHSAQIRFREPDVSGHHLELREEADGVYAVCLSRNGFILNNENIATGESRKVFPGNVIALGTRAKFRIDSINGAAGMTQSHEEGATLETRFMTSGATMATRDVTMATRSVTMATRAISGGMLAAQQYVSTQPQADDPESAILPPDLFPSPAASTVDPAPQAPQGSMEEAPMTADHSAFLPHDIPPPPPPPPPQPRPPIDDSETAEDLTALNTPAGFGSDGDSTSGVDVETMTSAGGTDAGKTVEMKTRLGSMDEIFRMKRMLEAKKRFRRKLIGFAALAFAAVVGTILFVHWTRTEKYLSTPTIPGTKKPDWASYISKNPSGGIDMEVKYPSDSKMRVLESSTGLEVTTYTGRKRNVMFRLAFSARTDEWQLHHSLSEAAAAEMADLEKRGYTFFRAVDDASVDPTEREGIFFYELKYPGWCQAIAERGTRYFEREFTRVDSSVKWHGIMMVLRTGNRIFRLTKEIPDEDWVRGKGIMRIEPNIALYTGFIAKYWESPGDNALGSDLKRGIDDLFASVDRLMDRGRVIDWPTIARQIDALKVLTYNSSNDVRARADALLSKFRAMKGNLYSTYCNDYKRAVITSDEAAVKSVYAKCFEAFGHDASDLRCRRVTDPKEWKCQLED